MLGEYPTTVSGKGGLSIVNQIKRTKGDKAFDGINLFFLTLGCLIVLYPLYFIVIASISDPNRIFAGDVLFLPKGVTFDGYGRIFFPIRAFGTDSKIRLFIPRLGQR